MNDATEATDGSTTGRTAVKLVVIGLVAMWGYVVYLAFFVGRADSPDKIDDPQFTEAAEERCASAEARVADLPPAESQADDPVGRAATVEEATEIWADVVDGLRSIPVRDPDDADLVAQWLDDWDVLIGDRFQFAERLREDPDARFTVTPAPGGRQITLRIDEFAVTNDMASCATPLDV